MSRSRRRRNTSRKCAKSGIGWTQRERGESLQVWKEREHLHEKVNTEPEIYMEAEIERQRHRVKNARGSAKAKAKSELERLEREQDEINVRSI